MSVTMPMSIALMSVVAPPPLMPHGSPMMLNRGLKLTGQAGALRGILSCGREPLTSGMLRIPSAPTRVPLMSSSSRRGEACRSLARASSVT